MAVGTALSVAILAPALVWISFLAPAAWSSAGFVVGFVAAGAVLFFLCFGFFKRKDGIFLVWFELVWFDQVRSGPVRPARRARPRSCRRSTVDRR